MTRRCKPGQRARIIGGMNNGRVVLVVKALHTRGNEFDGSLWHMAIYPWVVASLGAPLRCRWTDTGEEAPPKETLINRSRRAWRVHA